MMPAKILADRTLKIRPEKMMEMAVACLFSSAKSAASGKRICRVTVTTPTRKERVLKTIRFFVTASPIVKLVDDATSQRIN